MKIALTTLASALICATIASADTDLRGTWTGDYTAVSPTNNNGEGPRFAKAEWRLEITDQQGPVFYGSSSWRPMGSDTWRNYQATGNIRADGSGYVGIMEIGTEPPYAVNSIINGQLDGNKIYVDFRGLNTGVTYSAVLEKEEGGN